MGKMSMALGFGVGYLLGTRAGRERFDELKRTGEKVVQRPEVQQARERIMMVASEKLPINGAGAEPHRSRAHSSEQTSAQTRTRSEARSGTDSGARHLNASEGSDTGAV